MEYHIDQTNVSSVKEDATAYGYHSFEAEFAKRTLANLDFIEKEVDRRHAMNIEDKDIHDVFEVTQLINSFVGMLILPKEKYYEKLGNKTVFKSDEANDILRYLENDPQKYFSTYKRKDSCGKWQTEELTPKNLARHFRNAVAHNRLTILPKDARGDGIITGVEFLDESRHGESFRLELNLNEIRTLLIALCNTILNAAKVN